MYNTKRSIKSYFFIITICVLPLLLMPILSETSLSVFRYIRLCYVVTGMLIGLISRDKRNVIPYCLAGIIIPALTYSFFVYPMLHSSILIGVFESALCFVCTIIGAYVYFFIKLLLTYIRHSEQRRIINEKLITLLRKI
jgi:hypothetical protein